MWCVLATFVYSRAHCMAAMVKAHNSLRGRQVRHKRWNGHTSCTLPAHLQAAQLGRELLGTNGLL